MSAQQWFELPPYSTRNRQVSARIRAWEPADGLTCRNAAMSRKIPCSVPAAVVVTTSKYTDAYRSGERPHTGVYCARHVSEIVRKHVGERRAHYDSHSTELARAAEEKVLAAHWAEYQEALAQLVADSRDRYLSMLPAWLKDAVEAAEAVEP